MKIIKLVTVIIFSVLFLVGLSGCTNPYIATIELINNYTKKAHLALGIDNNFIVKEGTTLNINMEKGYYFIQDVAPEGSKSEVLILKHDIYSIEDWIVFYNVNDTEKEHTTLLDINNDYKFEYGRTYKITIDENKDVTLQVVTPTN